MKEKIKNFFQKIDGLEKGLIIVGLCGIIVTAVGLFRGILGSSQVKIEYLNTSASPEIEAKIVADIEGAVNLPGVYELNANSRIKDILVMAGGYGVKADREYCEKTINLAQILKDGQKIYIPFLSDTPKTLGYDEAKSTTKMININTATDKELDTIWGIGEARIESIVKNRPYQNLDELLTKKVLTKQILEKNKELLTVY